MRIDQALSEAVTRLAHHASGETATPHLDAQLLMAHVLGRSRTWLYTWGDREIEGVELEQFNNLVERREQGEPVAWLLGYREFFGLRLAVSPHTLIPRPDTETLVEQALQRMAVTGSGRVLDLGTGSGAIALALASERPDWHVTGLDIVPEAITLARRNAEMLDITNVCFEESDFFSSLNPSARFELIVSNPPYIDELDEHLGQGDVRFEPRSALVAEQSGLGDLLHLIDTARTFLTPEGWLLLEHGFQQGEPVRAALVDAGYQCVGTCRDLGGRERISLGQWFEASSELLNGTGS
ncbi:peptide chain release factor N(5)-glutamine methyltransferase [Kushneria marisflavi]|uniref:Release factor glutamine methyltransferase n=1 Tax=Kushneria marisflavi TaxID=157779 RepID=A0A240URU0_9GAMM|nr:peptide chain release factor N(5)-glutamine methyltransferase [Kushneria marisflavi]ART64211.1 protein-(glutamine-N5) methyltransferase, release factor-specific [Kushneria marisflavi]RKD76668.1 [protein release factor]-glutamine N5-methyltransferase [Kushneria marisflavi]